MPALILQPEELATLLVIHEGFYPAGRMHDPMILRLLALGLLDADEQGNWRITHLAEAALARRAGRLH
jgi:hypothetical protein